MNAPLPKAVAFDTVDIEVGAARLIIPTRAIAKAMLERLFAGEVTASVGVPKIGEPWQGGTYAGVIRGVDGQPDQHLILCTKVEAELAWQDAMNWATSMDIDGHHDWTLPTRKEQALLFANVGDLIKPEFHWSSEQPAEPSAYAWGAHFGTGTQYYGLKGDKYRARAVRRVPIQ